MTDQLHPEQNPHVRVIKSWEYRGLTCMITRKNRPWTGNDYCGYVRTPRAVAAKHVVEQEVDVHGGITYAFEQPGHGFLYGFDTMHAMDDTDLRCSDVDGYITQQVESMADQLIAMAG